MIKVNEYFGGNVKSLALKTPEGPATVGVMNAGEFEFGTATREIITVITGKLTVRLPGSESWKEFTAGQTFEIEPQLKFQLKVEADASYLCLYR